MKPGFRICTWAGFWFGAASLGALQAGAQTPPEFDRNGPYLMAGGGYSFEYFDDVDTLRFEFDDDDDITFPLNADDSPHVIVHAGWRFHPHAAVDIGFEWNTGFDADYGGIETEIETYLTTVGVKIYALKGRIQPFLHPGIGIMVVKADRPSYGEMAARADGDVPLDPNDRNAPEISDGLPDKKTTPALRGGGGIDVYITENLIVSFSAYYVLPFDSDLQDARYVPVSAAVGWRF